MRVLVCGGAGFIGAHLARRLAAEGHDVEIMDLKRGVDLRQPRPFERYDEVYQLAADMGGAGFVFTGENDAAILANNVLINANVARACVANRVGRVLYASSACVYPDGPCEEGNAYPAQPDSDYGWEKLFSERLWAAHARNHGLPVRIARLHNVFGPEGSWNDGREKAPAALCRKVAAARNGESVEIWGAGEQTRSFLYVDECVEGLIRLMRSDVEAPVNIGSEREISIRELARMIAAIAGKDLDIRSVAGPVGVSGRVSDNRRIKAALDWAPAERLEEGLAKTYAWIEGEMMRQAA